MTDPTLFARCALRGHHRRPEFITEAEDPCPMCGGPRRPRPSSSRTRRAALVEWLFGSVLLVHRLSDRVYPPVDAWRAYWREDYLRGERSGVAWVFILLLGAVGPGVCAPYAIASFPYPEGAVFAALVVPILYIPSMLAACAVWIVGQFWWLLFRSAVGLYIQGSAEIAWLGTLILSQLLDVRDDVNPYRYLDYLDQTPDEEAG